MAPRNAEKLEMSSLRRGVLISFEGIDASGKSTQSKLLFDWFKSKGFGSEYISFPDYSTPVGREISAFLSGKTSYGAEARHMLYSINRYGHKDQIEGWLSERKAVVVNRYCESNIAYGVAAGLPAQWLRELEERMPQSDYVFFLDSTPETSSRRKALRDRFEADRDYLSRVSKVYKALSEDPRWFRIDADNSKEAIHYEITTLTARLLEEFWESEIKH